MKPDVLTGGRRRLTLSYWCRGFVLFSILAVKSVIMAADSPAAADSSGLIAEARVLQSVSSIDPASYPVPMSSANACPAGGRSPNTGTLLTDPCPHKRPDLKLWESASTWPSGVVPSNGAAVTLPAATKVLITGCSLAGISALASITVPKGSELIFDNAAINTTLTGIYLYGKMRIGSETCRVPSPITITFVPAPSMASDLMGIKVSPGGLLDLHGALFSPTWTRLAATATPGSTSVTLQAAVNWKAGQLVMIPTSIFRDEDTNQNEVMTLLSVSPDGKTLTFTSPLLFYHYGGPEYQTEVVLLSRSILLQGSPASEATKLGGQVRIEGQGRIEGTLAYRMGQLNVIGAYPFHWHMVGATNGSWNYIKDSSIYNAFFRCVAVHGTDNMLVRSNTAFHALGHCFYVEDGVEERNTFERNFAGFVHTIGKPADGNAFSEGPNLIQPADSTASGFYAANPNNNFKDNAASGGWAGFAFPTLGKPIGMSRNSTVEPRKRPLGTFTGNTAHSSGYFTQTAGSMYLGGNLYYDGSGVLTYSSPGSEFDPRDAAGKEIYQILKGNKVWLGNMGVVGWGPRVQVVDWQAVDCVRGATLFGKAILKNAIINLNSGNIWDQFPDPKNPWATQVRAGFQFYDVGVMTILSNITFMNIPYQPETGNVRPAAIYSMSHSDVFKNAHISTIRGVKFVNVDPRAIVRHDNTWDTGASRYFNFLDWDGSVTSRGRPTVVASWLSWWRAGKECVFRTEWNMWTCDWFPWRTVARLDMSIPGYTAKVDGHSENYLSTPENYAGWAAQFGSGFGDAARNMTLTRNEGLTGLTGNGGWYVHWKEGVAPYMKVWVYQMPPGTSVIFATRYPPGTTFTIFRNFTWIPDWNSKVEQAWSLSELLNDDAGEKYWFSGKHLYIRMTAPRIFFEPELLAADGAEVPGAWWYNMFYDINANMTTCTKNSGGQFCIMADAPATDIPPAITTSYNMWTQPYCVDIPPPDGTTCAYQKATGKCTTTALASPADTRVRSAGGFCSVTCGRCVAGKRTCVDTPVPSGVFGGRKNCTQLASEGACDKWWMNQACGDSCGICNGRGPPCLNIKTSWSAPCDVLVGWGSCKESWLIDGKYCQISCGYCTPKPPPPAPFPPSPPKPPKPPSPPRPPPPPPRPPPA